MRFIFDCEDDVCLPAAYGLVEHIKPFLEKVKSIDIDGEKPQTRKEVLALILRNCMVTYPKDTGELFSKLWILEEGERAPNTFRTMATLFANQTAVDFFTSVLPSLLQISKELSPLLKSKK